MGERQWMPSVPPLRRRPRARGRLPLAVAAGLLLGLMAGCSEDGEEPDGPDGTGAGTETGTADVPFQLVLDDQVSVSPDGERVLADCWNGICTWDAATGTLTLVPDRNQVAVAPDWSRVATARGGTVVLQPLEAEGPEQTLDGLDDAEVTDGSPVTAVAFSPDGSRVAAAGPGAEVLVWSLEEGVVASLTASYGPEELAFSPDGTRLAIAGGGPVEVHDLAAEDVLALGDGVSPAVAWSPDGRWLAGATDDGVPVIWDAAEGAEVARLPGVRLHDLAFSPDSSTLAVTALDTTVVRLWTVGDGATDPSGAEVRELVGHLDEPGALAFAPDGATLYSVAAEDGVLAWTLPRGRPEAFEVPEGP